MGELNNTAVPNLDKPNEGIIGSVINSAGNAYNYVAESVQGTMDKISKDGNKEQAKGNVPGETDIINRAKGAAGYLADGVSEHAHKTAADANKNAI